MESNTPRIFAVHVTPHAAKRQQVLSHLRPGHSDPRRVLEALINLNNARHTACGRTVSNKTRSERASFLRRFFRDLHEKAGFAKLPDPRNIGHRHIQAMVEVWRREELAPATIQTYFSLLRGLALWVGKPGLVRGPAHYGMAREEYERHEVATRDKSWSAQGIDIEQLLQRIELHDPYVGVQLRLIQAFGLRRKEAIMFKSHMRTVAWQGPDGSAQRFVLIRDGAKGGRPRYLPVDSPQRELALSLAESIAVHPDDHVADPDRDLRQNLRRFDNVLAQFGLTRRQLGATAHGLRHEILQAEYTRLTGSPPPVRGGEPVPFGPDRIARRKVARLAGHGRARASSAYLGPSAVVRSKHRKPPPTGEPDDTVSA